MQNDQSFKDVLSATEKILSTKPIGAGDHDIKSILYKLCYSTSIDVMHNYFYTNPALMEIFLQNCASVYGDMISKKRDEETLDLLVKILHNVVHHLKKAEPQAAELPEDLQAVYNLL